MTPAEAQPAGPGAIPAPLAETITGAVLALADVDRLGLVANDLRLSHAEVVARAAARAAWLQAGRRTAPSTSPSCSTTCPSSSSGSRRRRWPAPWWSGPTPRTAATSWCATSPTPSASSSITDSAYLPLVEGARIGDALGEVRHDQRARAGARHRPGAATRSRRTRRPTPTSVADRSVTPETLGYLLFTSGTSGAPKACLCSQGRLARIGAIVAQMYALDARGRLLPLHAALPLQRARWPAGARR